MIYAIIFFSKILEVSISTVRLVLIARGNRIVASLLAAVEVTIWLLVSSKVLLTLWEDPFLAVAYVLAVMVGIYLGVFIEDKLALGLSQIEVIAEIEEGRIIAKKLRDNGYRATTYEGEGLDGKKLSIVLKVLRKDVPVTTSILKEYDHLFVTITDIKKISIGSIIKQATH